VGDKECYEVAVTFPPEDTGFQRRYQVYYTKDTGRLLRVRDISISPGGKKKDSVTDYANVSSGPTSTLDLPCLVPLDWPDWSQENVAAPAEGSRRTSQATTHATAQSTDSPSQPRDEITLTTQVGRKEVKVVQQWVKGQPWWSQAKKYDNGRLVADAVLLKVNGQTP
jgi:hypothetical protein